MKPAPKKRKSPSPPPSVVPKSPGYVPRSPTPSPPSSPRFVPEEEILPVKVVYRERIFHPEVKTPTRKNLDRRVSVLLDQVGARECMRMSSKSSSGGEVVNPGEILFVIKYGDHGGYSMGPESIRWEAYGSELHGPGWYGYEGYIRARFLAGPGYSSLANALHKCWAKACTEFLEYTCYGSDRCNREGAQLELEVIYRE